VHNYLFTRLICLGWPGTIGAPMKGQEEPWPPQTFFEIFLMLYENCFFFIFLIMYKKFNFLEFFK